MSSYIDNAKKPIQKKTGLGRGLGSLLGAQSQEEDSEFEAKEARATANLHRTTIIKEEKPKAAEPLAPRVLDAERIWKIAIEKLKGNPNQPRKAFEKEALAELAASIKEQGILQPITARKIANGNFEIVAGERRWRAAQMAGLHEVPVILSEANTQKALELALIENIQREDLNPIEEAEAYAYLAKEFQLTQQQLAEKVGKDRATVANLMRLLQLQPEVREMVVAGILSLGLAKVLLAVQDPKDQKKLAAKVRDLNMTVRGAEKLVAGYLREKQAKDSGHAAIDNIDFSSKLMKSLGEELQKSLGTKVQIDYTQGKGKISIHFYSDDEMNGLVEKLRGQWRKQN